MARVLGVSTAGYYAWRSRPPCLRRTAYDALLKRMRANPEASSNACTRSTESAFSDAWSGPSRIAPPWDPSSLRVDACRGRGFRECLLWHPDCPKLRFRFREVTVSVAPIKAVQTSGALSPEQPFMAAAANGWDGWIAAIEGGTDERLLNAERGITGPAPAPMRSL